MIKLFDAQTGEMIGSITEAQLQFLKEQLEEESLEDQDYAIARMTVAYFATLDADPQLITLLTRALGTKEEVIIRWTRE